MAGEAEDMVTKERDDRSEGKMNIVGMVRKQEKEDENKENIPELIHQDSNKEKKLNNQKELSNNGKGPLGMKTKDIVAISSSALSTSLNVEQPTSTSSDEQIELGILGDRKDEDAKTIEKLRDRYFLVFVKSIIS